MSTFVMCAASAGFIAAAAVMVRMVAGLGEFELPDISAEPEEGTLTEQ